MIVDPAYWITQALHGLQFSMLLFLLSVGLTVIFGLLHFVNLAHGALYAVGAYIGFTAVQVTNSFWIGLLAAPFFVAILGLILYLGLLRHLRDAGPMAQVLVTFGLIFIFFDLIRLGWGDEALGIEPPPALSGTVILAGEISYSAYRLFLIALGATIMLGLHLILALTPIGARIRASVDNREMAACLGINVEYIFITVFCLGCALAGLAGAAAAPVFAITPDMGTDILIPTLIVVVIGGLGSLRGAIAGSFLVGFIETFGAVIAPQISAILVYMLLASILILKPAGLFPAQQVR